MTTSVRFYLSYNHFKLDFIVFKVDINSVENDTLSRMSLWRYMYAPKCYVMCGHKIFMAWRYPLNNNDVIWAAPSEFGTYRLCEQRRFRRACASAQSRQNLRCSLIQAVSQEDPSDRKPDPWPLWMAGHAQLKFVMTECSKTQIRLTRPTMIIENMYQLLY